MGGVGLVASVRTVAVQRASAKRLVAGELSRRRRIALREWGTTSSGSCSSTGSTSKASSLEQIELIPSRCTALPIPETLIRGLRGKIVHSLGS